MEYPCFVLLSDSPSSANYYGLFFLSLYPFHIDCCLFCFSVFIIFFSVFHLYISPSFLPNKNHFQEHSMIPTLHIWSTTIFQHTFPPFFSRCQGLSNILLISRFISHYSSVVFFVCDSPCLKLFQKLLIFTEITSFSHFAHTLYFMRKLWFVWWFLLFQQFFAHFLPFSTFFLSLNYLNSNWFYYY